MSYNSKILRLFFYPIKSLRGIEVESVDIGFDGLAYDRQWMLIDDKNKAITQRNCPELSLINTTMMNDQLYVGYEESMISLPIATTLDINDYTDNFESIVPATIFSEDEILVEEMTNQVSEWFSDHLKKNMRLVRNLESFPRRKYIEKFDTVIPLKFVDGYPVHIISDATMAHFENEMGGENYLHRFRPNILVTGSKAFEEDHWTEILGKDFKLKVVKRTGRCVIPGINPQSGVSESNVLKWLATNRKKDNSTLFGIYCVISKKGKASINEDLSIINS